MKYLSTQHFSTITIEDAGAIRFIVPVDLAIIVFWFLANRPARLTGLIVLSACRDVVGGWHLVCDGLSWGYFILRGLVCNLLTVQVAYSFG